MANDLISRADAIDAFNSYLGLSAVSRTIQNMTSIQEILEKLPSAEPEIIRCKDCLKYDAHGHRCKHWNHAVVVRDWCSRAERKENR